MLILLCSLFVLALAGYVFARRCKLKTSAAPSAAPKSDRWILLEIERSDNAESGASWDIREIRKAA